MKSRSAKAMSAVTSALPTGHWSALLLLLPFACGIGACAAAVSEGTYTAYFSAELEPVAGVAQAELRIEQSGDTLRELDFAMPAERYEVRSADGAVERSGARVRWRVPEGGGTLRYSYVVANKRANGAYDAQLNAAGALFRGDDLFPPARVRMQRGSRGRSLVQINTPEGWSAWTQYGATNEGFVPVADPRRAFDRPTGWMIAGELGVRLDKLPDVVVAVAAWQGSSIRRNDLLAFLRLHLAEARQITGRFPPRLLVVAADDPFWRGGLSATQSFYLHGDRPLISENGTSTVLHELMHVAMRLGGGEGGDWLIEGIAEFYSLELMRRIGTISEERFAAAIASLENWGRQAPSLFVDRSAGPVTARAVALLAALEQRWAREEPSAARRLDAAVRAVVEAAEPLTLARFLSALEGAGASAALRQWFADSARGSTTGAAQKTGAAQE
ncbi:MAG: hypothetical protein AAGG11_10055 [Pseudomonadota bacterium]